MEAVLLEASVGTGLAERAVLQQLLVGTTHALHAASTDQTRDTPKARAFSRDETRTPCS